MTKPNNYDGTTHPLQSSKFDNVGLRPNSKLSTFLKEKGIGSMSRAFKGMQEAHDSTFASFKKIDGDTTLTKGAKDLLKGEIGIKAKEAFINNASQLRNDAKGLLNHLNDNLYTNKAQVDQNQMMLVGLVGEQLNKEGLKYLDRAEYIHPVANMIAKAKLLPYEQNEAVITKLNNKHSADTLRDISATEDILVSIDSAIEVEDRLIQANTPAEADLAKLQASSALSEVRKLTGGV